jgi:hypothetical protein
VDTSGVESGAHVSCAYEGEHQCVRDRSGQRVARRRAAQVSRGQIEITVIRRDGSETGKGALVRARKFAASPIHPPFEF